MAKRKSTRKRSGTSSKARRVVGKARKIVRTVARRRKGSGVGKKTTPKNLMIDAAALVGGFTLAGIAGQTLAARGVNPNVAALIPAVVGAGVALKMKNPAVKIAGLAMVAAAGVNMVNSAMKQAAGNTIAGDDLDAIDSYRTPELLGAPMQMAGNGYSEQIEDSPFGDTMMGVPMELAGDVYSDNPLES